MTLWPTLAARFVAYVVIAVFIVAIYMAVVVGVGSAVGTHGRPNLALSVLAATVVAVTFESIRGRAERLAQRWTGGRGVAPYEVLARFSEQMAAAYPGREAISLMARLLTEGTGLARVEVWLRDVDTYILAARWPERATLLAGVGPDGGLEVRAASASMTPVRHRGDLLGALVAVTDSGRRPTSTQRRVLADLAVHVGLTLRNVALVRELTASRQRLVTAQDAERQRLERAISDRVGRRLAIVNATLRASDTLASCEDERSMLSVLRSETTTAERELRDLARGVYPPLLADEGLPAALAAHTHGPPLLITLQALEIGRYQQQIEAAVYFCCLEALQNVVKHAEANTAVVRLWVDDDRLRFIVCDDGVGFDPGRSTPGSGLRNMTDRVDALGGGLHIQSKRTSGTIVSGWLPIGPADAEP
jgi:signal transduction histidine kinase